jgi:putative phosphoribosyl transferase
VEPVRVPAGEVTLDGDLTLPAGARGLVVFAHGSGSSRHSPRNRHVAEALNRAGLATLLLDLLTPAEEEEDLRTRRLRFDVALLGERVVAAIDWTGAQEALAQMAVGAFGASTGAAAALIAAAQRPDRAGAVVSRGGRPDLAGDALERVRAPTLLIVGDRDIAVIAMNREAMARMRAPVEIELVPGASHLFEEPGALERVAELAADRFGRHLVR